MAESSIEWTQHTWNPVTGCTKVSPGCKHCYAETMARRLQAMGASGYEQGFKLTLHPDRLQQPLQRKYPTTYFVNSMSDLFHEEVPDSFIESVLATCSAAHQHTFQILTKRAERLPVFFRKRHCPANVVLGVSVEDKKYGLPRIDYLRKVKAKTRFLSIEPLLEDLGPINLDGIHWVIVGGESGPGARPMSPAWAQNVRDQAAAAGVPFFFKQWGAWGPDGVRRNKKVNGRLLDGRFWDETPKIT
ncbi:phage Gp37/Gp68 family protein [Hydrogenophaga sp. NH-16]|uniref:phage Gp37/Gp68 family protein n=1 Tax=Hydrogenophaga sp. NH-16 TaxID=2184519 RepID=UPI000FD72D33|nr:phage Gp37/Gp68 family protein [Hydrogenophaga sp. NH-16]